MGPWLHVGRDRLVDMRNHLLLLLLLLMTGDRDALELLVVSILTVCVSSTVRCSTTASSAADHSSIASTGSGGTSTTGTTATRHNYIVSLLLLRWLLLI
uniref:Putative secreted protein n=1 Tax=Anopheles triannulatus TaxID=58253 RepID=A0A2M4B207_9DIPT